MVAGWNTVIYWSTLTFKSRSHCDCALIDGFPRCTRRWHFEHKKAAQRVCRSVTCQWHVAWHEEHCGCRTIFDNRRRYCGVIRICRRRRRASFAPCYGPREVNHSGENSKICCAIRPRSKSSALILERMKAFKQS